LTFLLLPYLLLPSSVSPRAASVAPVIAHVAATVAPVSANFMRVMANISPVRFNLAAVCAQFRFGRALAAITAKFSGITAYVAPVNASLMPVPMNVSSIGPDLTPVAAQLMPLLRVYLAVRVGLLRARRKSQGRKHGRQYHAAKKYPFHLSCSSIKLRFQNRLPPTHHRAARKAFPGADRKHLEESKTTPARKLPRDI
jgi:hypothetical protein